MKIKEGYLLREVAGNFVVIPLGNDTVDFSGMITLSETGALLWKKLEEGADEAQLIKAMLDEYDVDEKTAAEDIRAFVKKLSDAGLISE
ncbi:MAG: PqqD family protein [Ruminococcaceae bacterium]|nr:PqqD family protein [Oscillospiraceae bacterium]